MRIISGSLRNRRLKESPAKVTRPTTDLVRGALFNILMPRIDGARFLDLFAGTGAVGLEAVSRGAADVVWVESDGRAFAALKINVTDLAPGAAHGLVRAKAKAYLERDEPPFDVIFADPPYANDLTDLLPLIAARLAADGIFIAEHASGQTPAAPPGLQPAFTKSYGGTMLSGFTPAEHVIPDPQRTDEN
jgi:16S rRNA (guanine966-N2)-methyltransferase